MMMNLSKIILFQFLFFLFAEQLIYFPNPRSILDSWITITADLFNEAINNDGIPITGMPLYNKKHG